MATQDSTSEIHGGGGSLSVNLSENNWAQTEVDNLQIHLSYNRNHMTDHSLSQKKSYYEFREIYFLSISEQTYLSRSWSKIYTSTVNVNLRVTNQKKKKQRTLHKDKLISSTPRIIFRTQQMLTLFVLKQPNTSTEHVPTVSLCKDSQRSPKAFFQQHFM